MPEKKEKQQQQQQSPRDKKKKNKKAPKVKIPKKLQPIQIWAIIDQDEPDNPVTFTATHEDAVEALDQYLYLKHYEHFRQWCPLHGLPVDHAKSWVAYSNKVLSSEYDGVNPLYAIVCINYEPNVVASLFRAYHHCVPMGLSFDTQEEISEFCDRMDKVPDSELTPIERALDLLLDDIENDHIAESAEVKARCPAYTNPLRSLIDKGDKKPDA